jgi:hypothetical protein
LNGFCAAAGLMLLDLGALAGMASRLRRLPARRQGLGLGLTLLLHFALLFAASAWLQGFAWMGRLAFTGGMLTPLALFLAAQILRLQLGQARGRAVAGPALESGAHERAGR